MCRAMSGILTMAVLGVLTGRTCAFAGVVRAPLGLVKNLVRGRASVQRGAGVRALLCPCSIGRACESGMFSVTQLEYMRASRESCDARDVSWHRAVTRLVHAHGPERAANNEIMHALDYEAVDDNKTLEVNATGAGKARAPLRKDKKKATQ